MSLGQFLAILRARYALVIVIWIVIVSLALGVSLILPKKFEASSSIVIDVRPDPVSVLAGAAALGTSVVATQVDIIQSERVALRVVKLLGLATNPAVQEQWRDETKGEGSVENWLADQFRRNLDVKPSRESNVIAISYTAPDPKFAAALANAFAQAYLETAVELKVSPARKFSVFFDQRVKDARDALEASQLKLSQFQKSNGIIATDDRLDIEMARLNELSTQLVALQAVAGESRSRQAQANATSGDKLAEVLNNGLVASLSADLGRQEAKLKEISSRLGDANPQVVELRANIAELRQRLDLETKRVVGGVVVSNTINTQRETQVRAALEAQRVKVLQMKALRDEGAVLQRDVENAQRTYDAVQARFSQTNLESLATQSNAEQLTQATAPLVPSRPRVLLNVAVGAFLGVILGAGVAIVLELINRRVRVEDDLAQALELPVLGSMPSSERKRLFSGQKGTLMEQRLLGLSDSGKGA